MKAVHLVEVNAGLQVVQNLANLHGSPQLDGPADSCSRLGRLPVRLENSLPQSYMSKSLDRSSVSPTAISHLPNALVQYLQDLDGMSGRSNLWLVMLKDGNASGPRCLKGAVAEVRSWNGTEASRN